MSKDEVVKRAHPYENTLLRAMSDEDLQLITKYLKPVQVKAGEVLYEPGDIVTNTYFPCGSTLVSYVVLMDDARAVEAALIGQEGAVGGIVSQGTLPSYCRALVQFDGTLLRIETAQLETLKTESITLRYLFARYSDSLLSQVFQAVACNATHTIEQRTAKWLVAAVDRTGDLSIPLTQEQLAAMMGVGRSYVARVISGLKTQGILDTMRGQVKVNNLTKLKHVSCDCNNLVITHFYDVLSGTYK